MLTQGFYDLMAGDTTLTGLIASFEGLPAIFTAGTVPENAVLPYVVSGGAVADAPADTKNSSGREIIRDIRCYAAANGSVGGINAIAEQVRALFHRQAVPAAGFIAEIVDTSGPVVADEDDTYGRVVTVRAILRAV